MDAVLHNDLWLDPACKKNASHEKRLLQLYRLKTDSSMSGLLFLCSFPPESHPFHDRVESAQHRV